MQKFLRQSTFNDYHEQLADERAETERFVHPNSAGEEGAEISRRSARGCGR
jgi:hypothetical protein